MNRFKRHANARSSTTLSSKPLNRFAMTEMTTTTARCSREDDSCDSLVTGDIALYAVPAGPNLESRNPALPIGLHPGCRCTRTGDTGQARPPLALADRSRRPNTTGAFDSLSWELAEGASRAPYSAIPSSTENQNRNGKD
jgi:hypothetical protein